jgi:hypothetical protein
MLVLRSEQRDGPAVDASPPTRPITRPSHGASFEEAHRSRHGLFWDRHLHDIVIWRHGTARCSAPLSKTANYLNILHLNNTGFPVPFPSGQSRHGLTE